MNDAFVCKTSGGQRLTEADAHEAFVHLDTDGDGLLSAEEFIRATIEFWSSTDPDAPGNWWMGRPTYQD